MKKPQVSNIIGHPFFHDVRLLGVVALAVLINIIIYIVILIQFKEAPDSIIFHYNVNTGILIDAPASTIYRIPMVGSFLIILNLPIAWLIYKQKKVIAYIIVSITALFQILMLLNIIALHRVNF